jgi:hypothetical protein
MKEVNLLVDNKGSERLATRGHGTKLGKRVLRKNGLTGVERCLCFLSKQKLPLQTLCAPTMRFELF